MKKKIEKSEHPELNQLILTKLREYPPNVVELAINAITLSESYPESSVYETLQSIIRDISRKSEESQ